MRVYRCSYMHRQFAVGSPELLTALQWFVFFKLVFVTIFLLTVGTLQLLQTGFFLRLVTSHRRTLLFCPIGFRVCPESHNRNITNLYMFLFFTGQLFVTNLYSQSLEPILKTPGGGDRYFELQTILLLHLFLSSSSQTKQEILEVLRVWSPTQCSELLDGAKNPRTRVNRAGLCRFQICSDWPRVQ